MLLCPKSGRISENGPVLRDAILIARSTIRREKTVVEAEISVAKAPHVSAIFGAGWYILAVRAHAVRESTAV
jgi:hypothetical protein